MDVNVKQFVCGENSILFCRFDDDPSLEIVAHLRDELIKSGFGAGTVLMGARCDIAILDADTLKQIGDLKTLNQLRDELDAAIYDLERQRA